MSVSLTPPADGDTLSGAAFTTETKKIEGFLQGGIAVGDMQAGVLRRTHLYKPDSDGWPSERSHEIQTGLVNRVVRDHWDPRQQVKRIDILKPMVGQDNVVPLAEGLSATIEHYGGSHYAKVSCFFGVKVSPMIIGTSPTTLAERLRGYVVLRSRDPSGILTTYAASKRQIEPGYVGYDSGAGAITADSRLRDSARFTQGVFTLSSTGTYDFWLEYVYDTTNDTDFKCVVFCQRGLKIALHKV